MSSKDHAAEDRDLVIRASEGDIEAFTKLVRGNSSLVYRVALRILGSENAQDASQEVWAKVWRNIKNFRGESTFTTWLYRITVNTCLSARRKEARREEREYSSDEMPYLAEPPDVDADPEAAALSAERREEIDGRPPTRESRTPGRACVAAHGGSLLRRDSRDTRRPRRDCQGLGKQGESRTSRGTGPATQPREHRRRGNLMSARRQEDAWAVLEKIGVYAAGELDGEEAREVEQLIYERPEYRRLAESYAGMLVMLSTLGSEEVEAPEVIVSYAERRAYLSAFLRQAEHVIGALVGDYVGALTFYLGLRPARQ